MKYALIIAVALFALACGTTPQEEEAALRALDPEFMEEPATNDSLPDTGLIEAPVGHLPAPSVQSIDALLEPFVPTNYEMFDRSTADLNNDGFADWVVACRHFAEDSIDTYNGELGRPLLILLADAQGNLTQAARNDYVILCNDCGGVFGDPFAGVEARPGYFEVKHYGGSAWRWTRDLGFKFNAREQQWMLNRITVMSYHTSAPDSATVETETTREFGSIAFEDYNWQE